MSDLKARYRGRFAPSPTGDLHFGSLIAAVASYLQARALRGEWLIRIEDIDEIRTVDGSADGILRTLDEFGFEWDQEVVYQSQRKTIYSDYLQQLFKKRAVYACDCSRSQLRVITEQIGRPGFYPGTCRPASLALDGPYALRCRVENRAIEFHDRIQGNQQANLQNTTGDFIIRRRDGFFAYLLVVVVDDAEQGITEVVRGADILDTTAQQIYLQELLDLPHPAYAHFPVAMDQKGAKLSKSHRALPIHRQNPSKLICQCLSFLGQSPPDDLVDAEINDLWQWAIEHWQIEKIPAQREIALPRTS